VACPGSGSTGTKTANWLFENWARTQRVSVPTVYHPTSVQEIVAAVLEVEGRRENVKAIGSGWAYGAVAVDESTKNVIATRGLRKKLSGSDPTKGIIPFALRDELKPTAARHLHVEAGIEIWRLNCMLDEQLGAMPTLGASNGQTIAGAIATSTHGTDVDAAPIADAVAAIHLVGPGGREWWIERDKDSGAITDPARMAQAQSQRRLCPDARVEYDTSLFRAVLVSMGRMGVVYSYVLKAVDRFALTMTRRNSTWTVERAKLRDPQKPFVDDSGKDIRWLEIFVNPYLDAAGDRACIVTSQKVEDRPFTAAPPGGAGFFEAFCESAQVTKILVEAKFQLGLLIPAVTAAAATALAPLNAIPVAGPILYAGALTLAVAAYWALDTELTILLARGGNFAQKLATVINQALLIPEFGRRLVPALIPALAAAVRPELPAGAETRRSFQNYTGQPPCTTDWENLPSRPESSSCEREIDGLELAFDMRPGKTNAFDFIDDVFAATDAMYARNEPPAFGMSLRFTGRTEALLGIQQWDRTCIIECFALRGVGSTPGLIRKLHELGGRHGAIQHWGQLNDLTAAQVRARYAKLSEWRQALRLIIDGGPGRAETFRTDFSTQCGLEPETYMPPTVAVPLDESGETYPYDFGTVQLHDQKTVEFHFANDGHHQLRVLGHDAEGDFRTQARPAATVPPIPRLATGGADLVGPTEALPRLPENLEVTDEDATAEPGEEIRVGVTFRALTPGVHRGKLRIYVNATNLGAIVIPLSARVEAFRLAVAQPSPATLAIGPVAIGSTAATTLVVRNDGTLAASLDGVSFSNPKVGGQIAVQTGGIAPGGSRAFALEYRPSFVGPLDTDVVLHFTDGALPPRHTQKVIVKLSAIGRGAQAQLAPTEFYFGQAPVGTESRSTWVTVRNIGLDPLSISHPLIGGDYRLLSALPTALAGGQSVRLEILFRPQGVGPRDSSFSVSTNSLYPPTPIALHGVGVAARVLRATPSPIVFDDTVAGSSRVATVAVSNPGAVAVRIGTVGLQAPGDFQIVRDTCVGAGLAPGDACELQLAFAPMTAGAKTSALEISGPAQPLAVAVSGLALPALGLVPDVSEVDFGTVAVGDKSKARRVTLTNRSAAAANVTDVLIQGPSAAEVIILATDCTGAALAPGASCAVRLQLTPAGIGTRSAALTALADVTAHEATLHGLGRAASMAWLTGPLDFGNMNVGAQTPTQDAALRNAGNAPAAILSVDVAGDAADFVVTELTPGIPSLQPTGIKGFRIRFKPTAPGNRRASLRVHSDAAGSPFELTLAGVGLTPP
jgi:hypothetical protein